MQELSLYEPPPEGFHDAIDADFDRSIRDFQESNGLKIDGLLLPGGETERNLIAYKTGEGFDGVGPDQVAIGGGVGFGGGNDTADVSAIKRAFGALDRYRYDRTRPPPPYIDSRLVEEIEAFQRENGLFDDGLIAPGGETLPALRDALAAQQPAGTDTPAPKDRINPEVGASIPLQNQPDAAAQDPDEAEWRQLLAQAGAPPPTARPKQGQSSPPAGGAPQPGAVAAPGKKTTPWATQGGGPSTANNPNKDPHPSSSLSPQWRTAIHREESQVGNYNERNHSDTAWGRYQMQVGALKDAGMIDAKGKWTGKYGAFSKADFLKNPVAQEKALADFMTAAERQLRSKGATKFVGQGIKGKVAPFNVTESGLLAAAHKEGAGRVNQYLQHLRNNGWVSDEKGFPPGLKDNFNAVETRLRKFEKIPR